MVCCACSAGTPSSVTVKVTCVAAGLRRSPASRRSSRCRCRCRLNRAPAGRFAAVRLSASPSGSRGAHDEAQQHAFVHATGSGIGVEHRRAVDRRPTVRVKVSLVAEARCAGVTDGDRHAGGTRRRQTPASQLDRGRPSPLSGGCRSPAARWPRSSTHPHRHRSRSAGCSGSGLHQRTLIPDRREHRRAVDVPTVSVKVSLSLRLGVPSSLTLTAHRVGARIAKLRRTVDRGRSRRRCR